MAGINESLQIAEKLAKAGSFVWDKTRVSLDLEIVNMPNSGIRIARYTRYVADGGVVVWAAERLGEHYKVHIREQLQTVKNTQTCTWAMDNGDTFTVCAAVTDLRTGSLKVEITKAAGQAGITKPFFIGPPRYGDILWSKPGTCLIHSSALGAHTAPNVDVLEGKRKSGYLGDIAPTGNEMVMGFSDHAPVIWGRRTFLAIDVIIVPEAVEERKVAAQLITTLDAGFPLSYGGQLGKIHEELLCRYMTTTGRPSVYRMDKMNLKLDVSFDREPSARLHVRILQVSRCPEDSRPLFLVTGERWKCLTTRMDIYITDYVSLYPNKEQSFRRFHVGCADSRLHSGEAYLHELPMLADGQSDFYLYAIEPAARANADFLQRYTHSDAKEKMQWVTGLPIKLRAINAYTHTRRFASVLNAHARLGLRLVNTIANGVPTNNALKQEALHDMFMSPLPETYARPKAISYG
ncbi:hypothetical protein THASP1DRAFT_25149 [Thamnocephalis sphaerospora]|uniref:Uncharacterized protein n=1 Tax=Thamnocephalis sphaerospora TaxID=78915 RepID=A0A4P9XL88_9FUNG|nr:hypothetical protein THASP1DRAFT_25149 [Thamnocephalis sphaerospora]|eukprot:RKP06556.1 hypothetical protein THASP1DRAFT_25149 [Thamnocephalis sphaerospora]